MHIQYWHQSRSSCARTFRQNCLRQINNTKCINYFLSTKPLHFETLWSDCSCINSINPAASQQVNPICFSTSGHAYSLRYTNGKLFVLYVVNGHVFGEFRVGSVACPRSSPDTCLSQYICCQRSDSTKTWLERVTSYREWSSLPT